MTMLFKSIAQEIQEIHGRDGIVTMYWSAFGNRDSDGDIIRSGAYSKTISERGPSGSNRIKFLWQHDPWEPIGMPRALAEDERGLLAEVKVAPTKRGRDALALYELNALEHSVGIDILKRSDEDQSVILEVRLWEGSAVTWGANPMTPLVSMKGVAAEDEWQRLYRRIENTQKALRQNLTHETKDALLISLGAIEQQIRQVESRLESLTKGDVGPDTGPTQPSKGTEGVVLDESIRLESPTVDAFASEVRGLKQLFTT